MGCIYTYQGKQYNKEEFYNYVKNNLVQPKTVQKYTKVLFPTGNTASRIEGHTTLEEFKKQKEDRIKELENRLILQNNNLKESIYFNGEYYSGKFDYTPKVTKEQIEKFTGASNSIYTIKFLEKDIDNITTEINQLKQELKRVETEGFGALKPIYNFYENTVTNILKKQGYNPILITDEYGNTWNEIELLDDFLDDFTIGSFKPRVPIPIPTNTSLEELYKEDVENSNNNCTFDTGK